MRLVATVLLAVLSVDCAESSTDRANDYFAARQRQEVADAPGEKRKQEDRQAHVNAELAAFSQQRAEDVKRQEEQEAAERAVSAKRKAKEQALVDWLRASPDQCATQLNHAPCRSGPVDAPVGSVQKCQTDCQMAIDKELLKRAADSFTECVGADGPVAATCNLVLPADADPRGTGIGEFAPALEKAKSACSELCSKQRGENLATAADRKRAAEQGSSLVLAYKRCMVATDSTVQAVRYRLYDRDLYDNLMQSTNDRCRAGSKCDWLEKYSQEFACEYSGR